MERTPGDRRHKLSSGVFPERSQAQNIDVGQLLRELPDAEAQVVLRMTADQSYNRGAGIFSLGDEQRGLYLVKKGLVEEFRLTENGSRLPMNRVGPGKLLALSTVEGRHCCFAEAVEESVVGFVSFQALEDLSRKFPRIAVNLVTLLARRLGELEDRLELLTLSSLRARVAGVLLKLYAAHGPRLERITHEALGEWAASSRPKVSMVLEELQKAGLVQLSRGEIQILNPVGLQEWARRVSVGE